MCPLGDIRLKLFTFSKYESEHCLQSNFGDQRSAKNVESGVDRLELGHHSALGVRPELSGATPPGFLSLTFPGHCIRALANSGGLRIAQKRPKSPELDREPLRSGLVFTAETAWQRASHFRGRRVQRGGEFGPADLLQTFRDRNRRIFGSANEA